MEDSVAEFVSSLRFTLNIDPSIVLIRIVVGVPFAAAAADAAAAWMDSSNNIVVKKDLIIVMTAALVEFL